MNCEKIIMRNLPFSPFLTFAAVVPLAIAPSVAMAADANAVLKGLDDALNRSDDAYFLYEMLDQQPGKDLRTLGLEVYMKGDKRLTAFTKPADLAGTKVLILSSTQMYVYLPAFKKVRRVASHVTEQGFMGTTYTQDLLAISRYAEHYTPKLTNDGEDAWVLELSEKPDGDGPYPKVIVTVRKKDYQPSKFEYFNGKGQHVKTEERMDYECRGEICAPETMKLTDHTDGDHWTKLVQRKWEPNGGLRDRIFTRRNLARGTRRGR